MVLLVLKLFVSSRPLKLEGVLYIYVYDGACHIKNYYYVITYLLEDEQELSLGMLHTSQMYL
jgi:hypothetical protein